MKLITADARPSPRTLISKPPLALCAALAVATIAALFASVPASAQQPPQLCKPGHNYDQAKGLCYDPATAYKADIPKAEESTGGFLSGLNSTLGLGNMLGLCQYGDKQVGSGDQTYCVSRRTGQAYPVSH